MPSALAFLLSEAKDGPWRPEVPADWVGDDTVVWLTNDAGDSLSVSRHDVSLLLNDALSNQAAAGYGLVEPWRNVTAALVAALTQENGLYGSLLGKLSYAISSVASPTEQAHRYEALVGAIEAALALLTEPDTATDKGS